MSRRINKKIDNKTFLNSVKEEISSLITQINETSDRNVLLLENRLEKLNSLLSSADSRISKLKNVIDDSLKIKDEEIKSEKVYIALEPEPEPEPEKIIEQKQIVEDDPSLSRRERILLLHKQGISSTVIANQTKATIGEVELIISLSRS
ncbi:MAG: hypothetical protein JXR64_11175 [Spirochaetales bacterium]|nr:hypothetical protein [Spirochaetales bacterium]